ncbi:hypothetical protein F2Q68_00009512 [Brassica cretica]|uniref:Uncharacterized protein n=1 Tax=Brassica cretica TaxID=69181 RepID=A0A8S9KY19_BRACR|nr:hypothetical protein F2Q68_00009512 [Brassica cretica]
MVWGSTAGAVETTAADAGKLSTTAIQKQSSSLRLTTPSKWRLYAALFPGTRETRPFSADQHTTPPFSTPSLRKVEAKVEEASHWVTRRYREKDSRHSSKHLRLKSPSDPIRFPVPHQQGQNSEHVDWEWGQKERGKRKNEDRVREEPPAPTSAGPEKSFAFC